MLYPLHDKLIQPSIRLAAEMSYRGMNIDKAKIKSLTKKFEVDKKRIAEEIYDEVGSRFNINSSIQVVNTVYKKFGILEASTDKKVIEPLAVDYPIIKKITKFRHIDHDINNYLTGLVTTADTNGLIHPIWNATGTKTGRWTCKYPAMQTFPKAMKEVIIPHKGNVFIGADYSQAEMRILAWYSQDPVLLKSVEEGIDLHSTNGAAFFNKNLQTFLTEYNNENPEYTKLRSDAKNLGFLLVYRGGIGAIIRLIHVNSAEAKRIKENYFRNLVKVMPWSDSIVAHTKKYKFVKSAYGRVRHFNNIDFKSMKTEVTNYGKSYQTYSDPNAHNAEKEAPNFLIQGTSVDYVNFSIIKVNRELAKLGGYVVAQVHDSGLFEVPIEHQQDGIDIIQHYMTQPVDPIDIKMDVDIDVGFNYKNMSRVIV